MKLKHLTALLVGCMLIGSAASLAEEDYIIAKPGDSGYDVRIILETAQKLGFLEQLPKDAETYTDEYLPVIQKLEEELSMEADGVIHLSEMEMLEGLIYPGSDGEAVEKILLKLANLGYIKKLPEKHSVYEQTYVTAVKAAEKKLSLIPDGYLTPAEQKAIMEEKSVIPDAVKNVKITSQNGTAVIRWSSSRNAVEYHVRRDGVVIATVMGTSYTDTDVKMGEYYHYTIIPQRYGSVGISAGAGVTIEPVYKKTSLQEMYNGTAAPYVQLPSLHWISGTVVGSDYHVRVSQKVGGRTYYATLILDDYKNWNWMGTDIAYDARRIRTVSGKGRYEKNGSEVMIYMSNIRYNW